MVELKEFLNLFDGTEFGVEDLKIFYRSVRKSVILSFFAKRALWELFALEDKYQWPLLQRIADPSLPLYQNSDKNILNAFMESINNEKLLREERSKLSHDEYWCSLFYLIEERVDLYRAVFNFGNKDVKRCANIAERYKRARQQQISDSKKLWQWFFPKKKVKNI